MGAHILVVDDDPLLAAALRRPLAYEGFEIEVAASGEEALSRALDHPPDLVILDVLLPGIDGLEVCRRLRQAGEVAGLVLTARPEGAGGGAGVEGGAATASGRPSCASATCAWTAPPTRSGGVSGPSPSPVRSSTCWPCSWSTRDRS